ncbi:GHKL domain-containing protein [uncultured Lactobacillus sp.]|uniref:GHKL domain-containing protein n=1 Tax=uncultured Lactobacillus sp. TaxID=153152 RepID=UPI0028037F31|nr:GHKL domain-containing protein [uncultured Lactobacillus sp.]
MLFVLFLFSLIVANFFEVWCFFKISRINFKNINIKIKLLVLILILILVIIEGFGNYLIGIVANLVEVVVLWKIFKDYKTELVIGSILIVLNINLSLTVLYNVILEIMFKRFELIPLNNRLVTQLVCTLLFSIIEYMIVIKFASSFYKQLISKNNKLFLGLLIYLYFSMETILIVYSLSNNFKIASEFFGLFFIIQSIFLLIFYYELLRIQQNLIKEQENKETKRKQRQLEEYASYLEKSEDDLRAFRHDYKNILNSLKISAQEGNVQEVIQKLDKYTETNLNTKALLKYKDVNHIYIKSIKSIIITKLTEMYNLNIPYNFECRSNIRQLPDHVDELDLVRIMGITLDNAIEESKALIAEKHNVRSAEIQIMLYSNSPNEFEYEVRNKIKESKISTHEIQQPGFTTKKNHKGLGLANVKEIEEKYPNMSISYMVQDGWFDFYMVIDTEDGEENE